MTVDVRGALDGLPWFQDKTERAIFAEIGYVCVFAVGPSGSSRVRIGYTTDLRKTVSDMQTDCWQTLAIKGLAWTGGLPTAQRLKAACHAILTRTNRGLMGDWFDVPDAMIPGILTLASRENGVPFLTHPALLEEVRAVRERRIQRAMSALA